MIFTELPVAGVVLIEPERIADERGWFTRTYDAEEFAQRGLAPEIAQSSVSFNARAGTLRGMHFQAAPHGETKLVRCTRGAIFDVAVDLRPDSPSYRRWAGAELTQENGRALLIPVGCAHGFQTLVDAAEVFYQISAPYVPGAGRGVRWDDPAFGVEWPAPPSGTRIMSDRDASYPDFVT